jgi:hypothetical protein
MLQMFWLLEGSGVYSAAIFGLRSARTLLTMLAFWGPFRPAPAGVLPLCNGSCSS